MELWRIYAALSVGVAALAVWLVAVACAGKSSGPRLLHERIALRRVILPLAAGAPVIAFFTGWALCEPNPADERAGLGLFILMSVAGVIVARATVRGLWALRRTVAEPIATVGFVRCRVVVDHEYRKTLSAEALDAALAHEAAHVRGRDPLRIWMAQLATDLQWPVPGARRRFQDWLMALELQRDDDALAAGARPLALAESILMAARHKHASGVHAVAGIVGDGRGLVFRVRRLMGHELSAPPPARHRSGVALFCSTLALALVLGALYGDLVLAALPGVR